MVSSINQIPALFLPKRSPDAKTALKPTSVKKNKKINNGSINEQKKNDAKKCSYLLRAM
jgi:hypothetical protein